MTRAAPRSSSSATNVPRMRSATARAIVSARAGTATSRSGATGRARQPSRTAPPTSTGSTPRPAAPSTARSSASWKELRRWLRKSPMENDCSGHRGRRLDNPSDASGLPENVAGRESPGGRDRTSGGPQRPGRPRVGVGQRVIPAGRQVERALPVQRGSHANELAAIVPRVGLLDEAAQRVEAAGGERDLDERRSGEELTDGMVEPDDLQHAGRRPECRAKGHPRAAGGGRIEVTVAPAHFDEANGAELDALRPDCRRDVGATHGEADVPAVANDPYRLDGLVGRRRMERRHWSQAPAEQGQGKQRGK